MPQVKIIAKNFMDMVASLPALKLDKLYDNTYICEAVLRSLPPLAKKYVLQLLCIDIPITAKSMEEWVLPDGFSKHRVAIDRLVQLRVFLETTDRKKESSYRLNPKFQINLQKYILHGGILPREAMPASITVRLPTLEELEAYALEQWELISSSQADRPTSFSSSMMKIFQRGLLSQRDKEAPRLTVNGFQFLLVQFAADGHECTALVHIREYISNSEDRGIDPADLISFLLELSFHATGEAYNTNTLTDVQRNIIKDLADLGLVKLQQGRKEGWFIPTKLVTNLSVSLSESSSRKEGFVVVETNFRTYAYSTSKLHCEILRLFSRVEYQLPNLIVGAITKESLCNAFENGITADQIISFLQQNAHPRVAQRVPSVPENVTDQIRLWEADLNRVDIVPANFYDEFPSKDVFESACDYAREYGGLLWEDSKKLRLVVTAEIHMQMREFLRRQN